MTTSMNNQDDTIGSGAEAGGALADTLTWSRILIMPIVVFLIWKGWQPVEQGGINLSLTVLASALFLIAALTDIVDDYLGGNERSVYRRYGYLDDIADNVLIMGTLGALLFVIGRAEMLTWLFAVPAVVIIAREVIVCLFRGYELSRYVVPDSKMTNAKSGLSMFATCLLLASPWLQGWLDQMRASPDNVADVFATTSPWVWLVGQGILWVAAILSVISAVILFKTPLTDFSEDSTP